jgi:hypothetical protein
MHTPLALSFRHRENQDGSWDSICMRCYLTAAHSYREQPLASVESGHHCDESSWLFKEPAFAVGIAPLPSPGRTCPPSARPRFAHPADISQSRHPTPRRHSGQPAGLREPAQFELSSGR